MARRRKLNPEDLKNNGEFELLEEVSHQNLKSFVMEQVRKEKYIIRIYSVYQMVLLTLFAFFLTRSVIFSIKGHPETIIQVGLAILFSFTILIIIHELLHAMAYFITGSRKISFGFILKKFVFYALADRQVVSSRAFHIVALAPFVVVKLVCLGGIVAFYDVPRVYFFISVMCLHSLFCAGDMAMLAFYNLHHGKEIYNFDDRSEGKTYFYVRIDKKV